MLDMVLWRVLFMVVGKSGLLRFLVLSIIVRYGRIHGYGVYKEFQRLGSWNPSIGTIYRVLNDLALKGFIEREVENVNGRRVVYYTASDKGVEEFLRVASCMLSKISIGLEIIIPTFTALKNKGLYNGCEDDVFNRMYHLLREYLGY